MILNTAVSFPSTTPMCRCGLCAHAWPAVYSSAFSHFPFRPSQMEIFPYDRLASADRGARS